MRENILRIFLIVFLVVSTMAVVSVSTASPGPAVISVEPPTNTAETGESFTVDINITDVSNLYSWEFFMNFSSTVLSVINVTEGLFLSDVDSTSWSLMPPYIDNHTGIVKASNLLWTYPDPPGGASGNGTLCTITFQVKDVGNTTLHFYFTELLTFDGIELLPIAYTAEDGYFSNVPVGEVGWINGSVTDFDTGLPLAGVSVEADVYFTTTDGSGNYALEVEPGTYTVAVSLAGYESSQTDVTVAAGETITVDFELRPELLTIDTLIMLVEDFIDQGEIKAGIQKSLLKKLYVAKEKLDAGKTKTSKNILNSFINHLKAQSGKHVPEHVANILITDAEHVINNL